MRRVGLTLFAGVVAGVLAGIAGGGPPKRVLVLGVDGMDPRLLGELIAAGKMPNSAALAAGGSFMELATSAPPQSPVAWSSVICGSGPGTHQIFDFVHRDASPSGGAVVRPYLSTSSVVPPKRDLVIPLGRWRIPLSSSRPQNLRRGPAFWESLADAGIEAQLHRMPCTYPPPEGDGSLRCLCGMGTPDLLGTYGEFTLFASNVPAGGRVVAGGRFARLEVIDHSASAVLSGPENALRRRSDGRSEPLTVTLEIVRDPERPLARIETCGEVIVLAEGEWSDWVPLEFPTGFPCSRLLGGLRVPTLIPAMARLYLKQVHPDLALYVSPLNIDPLRPAVPVASPATFARGIAESSGRYYTTGIPEDTKALRCGALSEEEFLEQTRVLRRERLRQYREALAQFARGFLFFYFGHIDQLSHVFWRDRDPLHPARDPAEAARFGTVIEDAYVEMDGLIGEATAALGAGDTLIVMSDHGFTSFRRGFNLNTWLLRNGYLALEDPSWQGRTAWLAGVDWSRTRAYAMGLNALYLNQAGRESRGVVDAGPQRRALLELITQGLLAARDGDGSRVVETVHRVDESCPGADPRIAPDLIVGYADGYRASWATAEGGVPGPLFEDNLDRWSGDHCVAPHLVPGVLLTNCSVLVDDPSLIDLAPTILGEFGLGPPREMSGRVIFVAPPPTGRRHVPPQDQD